ncbi:hypothetical protein HELRODRAFT_76002 [Helobdella robusta]|uniref:Uncharacterized protein n=1 Tax=Helobdella robusta TaxID=6412 RepID=T1G2D8_HELRO|nr:hypothetical protein HELRODRAFT_76002 [Helobdella robusta]ESO07719.1 hypothetical protein HELRODRAFT_76002 [Helobdella robusta]
MDKNLIVCENCKACKESEYQCNNGRCISKKYLCDSNVDCTEGDDEMEKTCVSCPKSLYRCSGQVLLCIQHWQRCDGTDDCLNGEDEKNCCLNIFSNQK